MLFFVYFYIISVILCGLLYTARCVYVSVRKSGDNAAEDELSESALADSH